MYIYIYIHGWMCICVCLSVYVSMCPNMSMIVTISIHPCTVKVCLEPYNNNSQNMDIFRYQHHKLNLCQGVKRWDVRHLCYRRIVKVSLSHTVSYLLSKPLPFHLTHLSLMSSPFYQNSLSYLVPLQSNYFHPSSLSRIDFRG